MEYTKDWYSSPRHGQLLLEVLVVVSVIAIVIPIGAQIVYVSLSSNKTAGEKNVGLGLVEETFEAVKAVATESWQGIFGLTKGSTNYYPQLSGSKWVVTLGSESVTINGLAYTRVFTVQNVCRDNSTRNVTGITDSSGSATTCTGSGGGHDPSTQRISVTVSWTNNSLAANEYITRWRNKTCLQTAWSSVGAGPASCPATTYDSATSITTGASLQISP